MGQIDLAFMKNGLLNLVEVKQYGPYLGDSQKKRLMNSCHGLAALLDISVSFQVITQSDIYDDACQK